jgi:hypothetical protein
MSVPVAFFWVTGMSHPGNYMTTQPLEMIKSDGIKQRGGSFSATRRRASDIYGIFRIYWGMKAAKPLKIYTHITSKGWDKLRSPIDDLVL